MPEIRHGKEISGIENMNSEMKNFSQIKPKEGMTFQAAQKFWDNLFSKEIAKTDVRDVNYFSTYAERLNQTPREDSDLGKWNGERGESKFIPNDQEIKAKLVERGLEGIDYKQGIPDFSEVSESTVKIDNMTENRVENFKQCDEKCADQWNGENKEGKSDWTARDVSQWRKENGYSWHERNDMNTCDLIPTKINAYFGHLGGVSECRKRDGVNDRGDFDE